MWIKPSPFAILRITCFMIQWITFNLLLLLQNIWGFTIVNCLNDLSSNLYRDRWHCVHVGTITCMNDQIGSVFSMGNG